MTDKEFIAKLEQRGIEYTVKRIDTGTYIEVGRFGYRFNERGKSRGGWIRNYTEDRTSDWEQWAALLTELQSDRKTALRCGSNDAMNKDTRTIMQLLRVDEQAALKIQNKMGENRLDFSECDQREFNHAARAAYRQILPLRPE